MSPIALDRDAASSDSARRTSCVRSARSGTLPITASTVIADRPSRPPRIQPLTLDHGNSRDDLSRGAQLVYDRLRAECEPEVAGQLDATSVPARSSPETRARILEMFKYGNRKYALPFEKNRLAAASFPGGNWEEYGQMAILETLPSIEGKLPSPATP